MRSRLENPIRKRAMRSPRPAQAWAPPPPRGFADQIGTAKPHSETEATSDLLDTYFQRRRAVRLPEIFRTDERSGTSPEPLPGKTTGSLVASDTDECVQRVSKDDYSGAESIRFSKVVRIISENARLGFDVQAILKNVAKSHMDKIMSWSDEYIESLSWNIHALDILKNPDRFDPGTTKRNEEPGRMLVKAAETGFFDLPEGELPGGLVEELGGLEGEEVDEKEMEEFRQAQELELEKTAHLYKAYLANQKSIYQKHYTSRSVLYKASDLTPKTVRSRGGWALRAGTDDLEQHLEGMQSIWIATSQSFQGAFHFLSNNPGVTYIYEIVGAFRGIDINGFIDELGKQEHMERKALDELALETEVPIKAIKRCWTQESQWQDFGPSSH